MKKKSIFVILGVVAVVAIAFIIYKQNKNTDNE